MQSPSYHWVRVGALVAGLAASGMLAGCGPTYMDLRRDGQEAVARGEYAPAAVLFAQANEKQPRTLANLHDLGICHTMIAKQKFAQRNHPAAFRELDKAIAYYEEALDARPGNLACTEGLNGALELKGQFKEALAKAEWAAKFVGPKAKQEIYLARELEERGDSDAALLRYRQAVSIEPENVQAHVALADFLIRHQQEKQALLHLRAAYDLDPTHPWVRDQLAARGALPVAVPASAGGS